MRIENWELRMKLFGKRDKKSKNGRQATAPRKDEKPTGAVTPSKINEAGKRSSNSIFSGDVLYSESVRRHYPFMLYFCLLILLYMGYIFTCQRTQREEIACRIELQKTQAKALLYSSERLQATRYNNITEEIAKRKIGIKQWNTPPKVIKRVEN